MELYFLLKQTVLEEIWEMRSKVMNLGSDTYGNLLFQKVLQILPFSPIKSIPKCFA